MPDLTDKQRAFVQEYLLDLNATQAAIRAGYSRASARQTGADNLSKPYIADEVKKAKAKRAQRTQVTQDKVLREIARLAFTDMRNFAKWGPQGVKLKSSDELTEDDAAAITEVSESHGEHGRTLKFKLGHKDSALRMLADHVGLFDKGQGKEGDEFDRLLEAINSGEPSFAQED